MFASGYAVSRCFQIRIHLQAPRLFVVIARFGTCICEAVLTAIVIWCIAASAIVLQSERFKTE